MKEPWRVAMGDLLLLSFAAGSADAAGFLSFGRVFTCNMTGNVVLFGISLGEQHWRDSIKFLFVLLMFAMGTGIGLRLSRRLDVTAWPPIAARVLGWEAGLLICFAVGWALFSPLPRHGWTYGFLAVLTIAMGLQTSALYRFKAPGMQTTALTATIATFVQTALHEDAAGQPEVRRRALFNAWVIVLYACGAMATGFFLFHLPRIVGAFPALFVLIVYLRRARQATTGSSGAGRK